MKSRESPSQNSFLRKGTITCTYCREALKNLPATFQKTWRELCLQLLPLLLIKRRATANNYNKNNNYRSSSNSRLRRKRFYFKGQIKMIKQLICKALRIRSWILIRFSKKKMPTAATAKLRRTTISKAIK